MNTRFNNHPNSCQAAAAKTATPTIDYSVKARTKSKFNKEQEHVITEEELLQFLWQF
jgi:hypothetical protein